MKARAITAWLSGPPRTVGGGVAQRHALRAPFGVVCAQNHLTRQLGPSIEVVRVIRWSDHVLLEVDELRRIGLQVTAVLGRKMEDGVHPRRGLRRDRGVLEVALQEPLPSRWPHGRRMSSKSPLDRLSATRTEAPQLRESIGQVGTNEGCHPVTRTCLPSSSSGPFAPPEDPFRAHDLVILAAGDEATARGIPESGL